MATLGYIKNSEQRPPGCPRIYVKGLPDVPAKYSRTLLKSWPDKKGEQLWELRFEVREGLEGLEHWGTHMGQALTGLSLDMWWLDLASVAKSLDRYEAKALAKWGEVFWPNYRGEGVILFDIGEMRDDIHQVVAQWELRFPVRFSPEHDYDTLEKERAAAEAARAKTSLWSRLMSRGD